MWGEGGLPEELWVLGELVVVAAGAVLGEKPGLRCVMVMGMGMESPRQRRNQLHREGRLRGRGGESVDGSWVMFQWSRRSWMMMWYNLSRRRLS